MRAKIFYPGTLLVHALVHLMGVVRTPGPQSMPANGALHRFGGEPSLQWVCPMVWLGHLYVTLFVNPREKQVGTLIANVASKRVSGLHVNNFFLWSPSYDEPPRQS